MMITALLTLLIILFTPHTQAAHYWGGQLAYECMGNNIYRVHWRGIRDCVGSPFIPNNTTVEPLLPNCNLPVAVGPWSQTVTTDITPMCPGIPTRCVSGGQFMGMEEWHQWRDYDFSNVNCVAYRFSMNTLRTSYIDTGPASSNFYLQTSTIDLTQSLCNKNPVFDHPSLMTLTQGQPAIYSQSATDRDGDSLIYSLSPCLQSDTHFVPYDTTFSGQNPLGNDYTMTIDPHTGDVEILPTPGTSIFRALICIKVEEYRNGVKIGEIIRDHIVFIFAPLVPNQYPVQQPYTNLSGIHQVVNDTFQVSAGYPFCFDVPITDADSADPLSISWDQGINGMDLINPGTGQVVDTVWGPNARFCWTPGQTGTYSFLLDVNDNACPIDGFVQNTITIVVDSGPPPVWTAGLAQSQACNVFDLVAFPQFGTPPYTYEWSGGGGLSQSPDRFDSTLTFTYAAPGTFPVSLTVTDAVGASATWTDTVEAIMTVEGTVTSNTVGPYANRFVYLTTMDPGDSTTYFVDSTATDANGAFSYCLKDSGLTLALWPDAAAFPNDLPTYLDSGLVWQDSRNLDPAISSQVNIVLQEKTISSGTGSLGGWVQKGSLQGGPVEGLRIVLLDGAENPVDWTRTDAGGYFYFAGLAQDSFFIWVDKPFVDNQLGPIVRLNMGDPNQDSLEFVLHPTWLELFSNMTHLTTSQYIGPAFQVGPNPFTHRFRICGILPYVGPVRVHLMDLEGRALLDLQWEHLPKGQIDLTVDPGVLPSGVYCLKIECEHTTTFHRLIHRP